jgi:hypothetical protein
MWPRLSLSRLLSGRLRPTELAIGPAEGGTRWTGYGEVGICALFAQIRVRGRLHESEPVWRAPHPNPLPQAGRGSGVAAPNAIALVRGGG